MTAMARQLSDNYPFQQPCLHICIPANWLLTCWGVVSPWQISWLSSARGLEKSVVHCGIQRYLWFSEGFREGHLWFSEGFRDVLGSLRDKRYLDMIFLFIYQPNCWDLWEISTKLLTLTRPPVKRSPVTIFPLQYSTRPHPTGC